MAQVNHNDRDHALLSASGASRWLSCTPSARLGEQYPDTTSDYALEGTLAHEMAEVALQHHFSMISTDALNAAMDDIEKHRLYDAEMPGQVQKHVDFVLDRFAELKAKDPDTYILLERIVDFSEWVPEGFGTGDVTIVCPNIGHIEIIDLKYGKGVQVFAAENSQLKLYGLGAFYEVDLVYEIETLTVSISQPRLDHFDSWDISQYDLVEWAERFVKPRAELAFNGKGTLVPGDHCRWCPHKARCKALHHDNMTIARHEFKAPDSLTDDELVEAYLKMTQIKDWLNGAKEHMLSQSLAGRDFPGMKLVQGTSRRKWADEEAVIKKLRRLKFKKGQYIKEKLAGLKEVGDLMTKDEFDKHFKALIIKPQGAPTVVTEEDPRPDIRQTAEDDFAQPYTGRKSSAENDFAK